MLLPRTRSMRSSFYEQPILNSPYEVHARHHALDADGQPLNLPPVAGRRRSELITPVPKPRKKQGKSGQKASQGSFVLPDARDLSTEDQEYNPTWVINDPAMVKPPSTRNDCPVTNLAS